VWNGLQRARTWARGQRNVHCWKILVLQSRAVKTVTENTSVSVVTSCVSKCLIDMITNPNPVCNYSITWQCAGSGRLLIGYFLGICLKGLRKSMDPRNSNSKFELHTPQIQIQNYICRPVRLAQRYRVYTKFQGNHVISSTKWHATETKMRICNVERA
jgi:hypothetical protein